ncbi:MAG: hypothetical protein EPO10_14565 [Reyranella sp.]|uniref:hypothetical protein n=1 Tax=Reyranella sp. TaxID=1929291 RepID=UPI0011FD92B6|nr:hypothetical protein [Reyranella sp.]TAJ97162.1 MAG: hypothetical protein EPO41_03990 [Reyranella sp.]TBR28139.1 MAG: hypothetical protein EPO10_14565 [Reyranella sp.]
MKLLPAIAGRAYFTPGSYTTLLAAADKIYAVPFVAGKGGITPDRIGVNVTTQGAGANCDVRFGIYADRNGRPGTLIGDFGAKTGLTSTGEHKVDIIGALRPFLWPGQLYWLAANFDGAASTQPTVAALATSVVPQEIAAYLGVADLASLPSSAATAGVGLRADLTYNISNALPDGGDLTWAVQLNTAVALVGLRAA